MITENDNITSEIQQAVINDNASLLETLLTNPLSENIKQNKGYNFHQLAKFLNKKNCLKLLNNNSDLYFQIINRDDASLMRYPLDQLQLILNFEYLPHLEFKDVNFLNTVAKWSKHYANKHLTSTKERWRQAYYAKELLSGYHPNIYIKWVNSNVGYGIFANEDIPKDTFIGEYTGEIQLVTQTYFTNNDYLWQYTPSLAPHVPIIKDCFATSINAKYKGNHTRFINHSDQNNLDSYYIFSEGLLRVCFLSIKDIPKDTQMTYDYGSTYWRNRKKKREIL